MGLINGKYWEVDGEHVVHDHGKGTYDLYIPALVGRELEGTKESLLSKRWGHQSIVDDLIDVVARHRRR